MDTTALIAAGGTYAERASELVAMFEKWRDGEGIRLMRSRQFRRYLAHYGRFTPFFLVAIPAHASRDQLPFRLTAERVGSGTTSALIAAGRVIVADVLGDPGQLDEPGKSIKFEKGGEPGKGEQPRRRIRRDVTWRIPLLGENSIDEPLNQSPITVERFALVMKKVVKTVKKVLAEWERALDAIVDHAEKSPHPNVNPPYYFVSYARSNSSLVKPICGELKNLGVRLWFDETSIPGGENFIASIADGIDGCEALVSFCSKEYSHSKMCLREVYYADDGGKNIYPAWLTDPALFKSMKFLLGLYNATKVCGLTPSSAANAIKQILP